MTEQKRQQLVSPIQNRSFPVIGSKPIVIYGEGGMPVRFYSALKQKEVVLTNEGWLDYDNYDRYDATSAYTQYARNFKNLPVIERHKAIEKTAQLPDVGNDNSSADNKPKKIKTPMVISHRHARTLMKDMLQKELLAAEKIKTKNATTTELFNETAHVQRMNTIITAREKRISEAKTAIQEFKQSVENRKGTTNSYSDNEIPNLDSVRDLSDEEIKTMQSNISPIEIFKRLFRSSSPNNDSGSKLEP